MRHAFLLSIVFTTFCFSSCSDEELFVSEEQQKIDYLKNEYGLKMVSGLEIVSEDLPETSIDDLCEFMQELQLLKNKKIPIRLVSNEKGNFELTIDDSIELPRTKSTAETVLISESLATSLALLTMNVWLDIATPAVVDSELTGVTLFDRWEQRSSQANRSGDRINFSASGVWYYKLFVNGIGDFYSYTGSFSDTYNLTTRTGDLYIL